LTLESKEKALELLPFYSKKTPYDCWAFFGLWPCLVFLFLGVMFTIMGITLDGRNLLNMGIGFGTPAVAGLLAVGSCWGCKYGARRRLELELTNTNLGRIVQQTLVKEGF
jgi:hypothetical protein